MKLIVGCRCFQPSFSHSNEVKYASPPKLSDSSIKESASRVRDMLNCSQLNKLVRVVISPSIAITTRAELYKGIVRPSVYNKSSTSKQHHIHTSTHHAPIRSSDQLTPSSIDSDDEQYLFPTISLALLAHSAIGSDMASRK